METLDLSKIESIVFDPASIYELTKDLRFPSLEVLKFGTSSLQDLSKYSFPKLKVLGLGNILDENYLPPLPLLEELSTMSLESLELLQLPSLKRLRLYRGRSMENVVLFPLLEELTVDSVPRHMDLTFLDRLLLKKLLLHYTDVVTLPSLANLTQLSANIDCINLTGLVVPNLQIIY